MSGIDGRMNAVISESMRIISRRSSSSSSRPRLLTSTISAGSMKKVFPVADSSCTMPLILRLCMGATGSTRRPSRTVGVVSLSRYPASTARAITRRIIELTDADIRDSSERISAR